MAAHDVARRYALARMRSGHHMEALLLAREHNLFALPDFNRDFTAQMLTCHCQLDHFRAVIEAGLVIDGTVIRDYLRDIVVATAPFRGFAVALNPALTAFLLSYCPLADILPRDGCNLFALVLSSPPSTLNNPLSRAIEQHCGSEAHWSCAEFMVQDLGLHFCAARRLVVAGVEVTTEQLPDVVRAHINFATPDTVIYMMDRCLSRRASVDWLKQWSNDAVPPGNWYGVLSNYPYVEHSPEHDEWKNEVARVMASLQDQAYDTVLAAAAQSEPEDPYDF